MRYENNRNPHGVPDALEARLRGLPQPPVPSGLEARLLAAIPARRVNTRRHWSVLVGALAAACLMAVLLLARRADNIPDRSPHRSNVESTEASNPLDESARIADALKARRELNEAKLPPFNWPLASQSPSKLSASIFRDSLE